MGTIRLELPDNDKGLSYQMYDIINERNDEEPITEIITDLPRKYRFAGYIGAIQFLFDKLKEAQEEIEKLKKAANKKKGWFG